MDRVHLRLPKISPTIYRRAKLQAWLEFQADVPLRYLWAAAGSGKTTVAVLYARSRPSPVAYIEIEAETTPADLYRRIALAVGAQPCDDYDILLDRLAAHERIELIVDNVDRAAPAVRVVLERIYLEVAECVTFIYLARSSEALALSAGEARGLVAISDPALFAFDVNEISLFAQALALDEDPLSVARLWRGTHGWATAVAGVCRWAAAHGIRLSEAWPQWRRTSQRSLDTIVADALCEVPPDVALAFRRLLERQDAADEQALQVFARHGLFVIEFQGRFLLNTLLGRDGASRDTDFEGRVLGPAIVEMFGRFEFHIDGQPVSWQRRRDREIVQYLAMQPGGRATRAELVACFWPSADRQLAAQSLRTACSTIRRAFAVRVGPANVARYFVADRVVELKLDGMNSTVGRFVTHIEHGDRAFDAGEAASACAHYAAAAKLYRAPFLAGEAPVAWSAPYAARLAAMHARCVARLENVPRLAGDRNAAVFRTIEAGQSRSA